MRVATKKSNDIDNDVISSYRSFAGKLGRRSSMSIDDSQKFRNFAYEESVLDKYARTFFFLKLLRTIKELFIGFITSSISVRWNFFDEEIFINAGGR